MTISLAVMRQNAKLGSYGMLNEQYVLALIDTVEAAWRYNPTCDEGVVHEEHDPDCRGCILRAALEQFGFGDRP